MTCFTRDVLLGDPFPGELVFFRLLHKQHPLERIAFILCNKSVYSLQLIRSHQNIDFLLKNC